MNIQFATYRANSDEHNRYEQFISEVTENKKLESWTATSKFAVGDLVLFYFGIPYKSIIAIGIVSSEPDLIHDQFDWTQKDKEYFCDFEPVWLLESPLKLPPKNDVLDKWYSEKPYRSTRILEKKIAALLLIEIFKLNSEVETFEELQRILPILVGDKSTDDEDKIDSLSIEDYKTAFKSIEEVTSEIDLKMLKANIEAPNHTITATRLAKVMDFANFNAANLRYGTFARKLCEFFRVKPAQYLYILVYLNKVNNEWHWTLRENVITAIIELGLFDNQIISNIASEIDKFKNEHGAIESTTTQSIIQSRIGQGLFRANLIDYWQGCSITGCQLIEILRASHIKPWRYSNNNERLDIFNGLLLMPNLDALFDSGLISFDDNGKILISQVLDKQYWEKIGITNTLKLRKIEKDHKIFLQFHRENIFQR